jgi:hypothetical protein
MILYEPYHSLKKVLPKGYTLKYFKGRDNSKDLVYFSNNVDILDWNNEYDSLGYIDIKK